MSAPGIAALLWLLVANVVAMLPSRDRHWTNAYVLIALAVPLVLWLALGPGPIWALAFVLAAGSVLRWPVIYLARWLRGVVRRVD